MEAAAPWRAVRMPWQPLWSHHVLTLCPPAAREPFPSSHRDIITCPPVFPTGWMIPPFSSTGAAAPPDTCICSWLVLGLLLSWASHRTITPHQSLLGNPREHFNNVKTPGLWNTLAQLQHIPLPIAAAWVRPGLVLPRPRLRGLLGLLLGEHRPVPPALLLPGKSHQRKG